MKLTDKQIERIFQGEDLMVIAHNSEIYKLSRSGNSQDIGIYYKSVSNRWMQIGLNYNHTIGLYIYEENYPFWKILK